MKKILFLIHDLGPGGAEKVLVNLVNNMNKEKWDITVMALFGGGVNGQFLNGDLKYIECHRKMIRGNSHIMKLFTPQTLYRFYIKEKYDIVVSYLEGPSARIISGCNDMDIKKVAWIHATINSKQAAAGSFRNYAEAVKCYNRFDSLVGVSNSICESFKRVIPLSIPMNTIHNTVESEKIRKASQQKTDIPINEKEINICAVGKLAANKGYDRLVHIQNKLKMKGYHTHFYFIGGGELRQDIENYCVKNGIDDSVTLLGFRENPFPYISKCNLFVCASHSEGYSTAATEALILGTPVITTDVSGMREMLGDNNEYGMIVENSEEALYNGIKMLLDDPRLLSHYKNMAIKRGEQFSTQKTITETEEFFEKVLNGK